MAITKLVAAMWMAAAMSTVPGCQKPIDVAAEKQPGIQDSSAANNSNPISLFDGESLGIWKPSVFGGDGEVKVDNGCMVLAMGDPLTGVACEKTDLPKCNYEISLEARRVSGDDFFCCLTFPVLDSHCSFVVGGWAGTVVGLSCLDDKDAARNETMRHMSFVKGQWYRIKVKVTQGNISCWIDDEKVVDASTVGRKISLRNEVNLSRPLGICSFQTVAEIRNIGIRDLQPEEIPEKAPPKK